MSRQPRVLRGKVSLVTGATGGLGKALARALVREGMKVAMADLDQARLDRVAAEIGGETLPLQLDVTDLAAYASYIEEVEERIGPLYALCNVAGVMPGGPFELEADETTAREIAVNLAAVIHSTKVAGRKMKARGEGHIVNVASAGGWVACGGGATYCGTKFGVLGYSESVALELQGTGVEISVIAPGVINTELATGLKDIRGMRRLEPDEVAERVVETLQHPRFVTFVPRAIGAMSMGYSVIPYGPRHAISRFFKTDRLLLEADFEARREYERKVAGGTEVEDRPASRVTAAS